MGYIKQAMLMIDDLTDIIPPNAGWTFLDGDSVPYALHSKGELAHIGVVREGDDLVYELSSPALIFDRYLAMSSELFINIHQLRHRLAELELLTEEVEDDE